jgi:hypothetical protein
MTMSRYVRVALVAAALIGTQAADAKEFEPGDLRICGVEGCTPITDRVALRAIGAFLYHRPLAPVVRAPRFGSASFELQFGNGYVTGVVGSRRLDRFLSYGVNIGHFERGRWYRVPGRAARELRRLASLPAVPPAANPTSSFDLFVHAALRALAPPLDPIPLTRAAVRRSR